SRALAIGGVALVVWIALAVVTQDWQGFLRSYLVAFMFWLSIPLGCLALLMIQHMAGGDWALVIRRLLEAATRTLPLIALLVIPVLAGVKLLYIWADPQVVAHDEILQKKQPYLNVPFFIVRAIIYFIVWGVLAYFLNKWSRQQDEAGSREYKDIKNKLQNLSGPGLVFFGGAMTFAAFDWMMSLDPHWYSTIYGILIMGGQALLAMAFIITATVFLSQYRPFSDVVAPRHLNDLGKLTLAFVMLWAYFSFSQFLITWSGNLPEEIPWYIERMQGGWKWVALALIAFHFILPFFLLIPKAANRNARILVSVAILIIVMRYVDLVYLAGPVGHHGEGQAEAAHHGPSLLNYIALILAPIGLGGLWLWYFARELQKRPLLPINDPGLEEAISHE
ncbi:MAG TPA: hypothetical protein VNO70_13940, partial [Blastocatellia bacterium]|nr:hypothetical protein [Blastocatellia bacterium]